MYLESPACLPACLNAATALIPRVATAWQQNAVKKQSLRDAGCAKCYLNGTGALSPLTHSFILWWINSETPPPPTTKCRRSQRHFCGRAIKCDSMSLHGSLDECAMDWKRDSFFFFLPPSRVDPCPLEKVWSAQRQTFVTHCRALGKGIHQAPLSSFDFAWERFLLPLWLPSATAETMSARLFFRLSVITRLPATAGGRGFSRHGRSYRVGS